MHTERGMGGEVGRGGGASPLPAVGGHRLEVGRASVPLWREGNEAGGITEHR